MAAGILGAIILFAALFGGKAVLLFLCDTPLIGHFATWFMAFIGDLGDGIQANIVYGAMAAQIVIIPLAIIFYSPRFIKRLGNRKDENNGVGK